MRYFVLLFVPLFGALLNPVLAQECTTTWTAQNGIWNDHNNWSLGIPTGTSVACITQPGSYTVTVPNLYGASAGTLIIGGESGTQTLHISGGRLSLGSNTSIVAANGHISLSTGTGLYDRGLFTSGTILVEGVITKRHFVDLLSEGGTLDVAPDGRLEVIASATSGQNSMGGENALFRIRGTLEADCGTSAFTCQMDAQIEVNGGTIRITQGRFDVRRNGSFRNPILYTAEDATLNIFATLSPTAERVFAVEGTFSGDPAGVVNFAGVDLNAADNVITLDMGGTGFQFRSIIGREAALTGTTGSFVNTGFAQLHGGGWGGGVRGVTFRNEGILEFGGNPSVHLWDDAVIENIAGATLVAAPASAGGGAGIQGNGRVENHGLFTRTLTGNGVTNILVPYHGHPGSSIAVPVGRRVDLQAGGSINSTTFSVAEGAELFMLTQDDTEALIWTIDGTLSGEILGQLRWSSSDFAAGPSNPVLDFSGQGLSFNAVIPGRRAALTSAGGEFRNVGRLQFAGANNKGIQGSTLVNEGLVEIVSQINFWDNGLLRNEASGTIRLVNNGVSSEENDGIIENHGLIVRHGDQTSVSLHGTLRSQPGSELRVTTGRLDLDLPTENSLPEGTTVSGMATMLFPNGLAIAGVVSPGTDDVRISDLTVHTSFLLTPSARLVIDIDEDGQSDRILFNNSTMPSELAGTLVVRIPTNYIPEIGDEFIIIQRPGGSTNIPGTFENIVAEADHVTATFAVEQPTSGTIVMRIVTVSNEGDGPGSELPQEVTLNTPYPNPTASSVTLHWALPTAGEVDIRIYDMLGREVMRVAEQRFIPAGWHHMSLTPNLPSGTYIVRLMSNNDGRIEARTQRLVIAR